ncbi:MAG: YciI family protein [Planctomycetes bacterium]|nr:YciI family protein [Planctomycetota bacterium]
MKYLCLVYLARERWHDCPDHRCAAYGQLLQQQGRLLAAEPLHPVETATTVRVRNGEVIVSDGPFAETKEQLAGFYLIDAVDLNAAIRIAAQIPPAKNGSIEVRPVRELDLGGASAPAANA